MYKLTQQTQNRRITPKEAETFLALNTFPGQRAYRPLKARHYADLLLLGALRPVNISFASGPSGVKHLMNGQHVCNACIMANREMSANIDYYRCDTDEDMWHLYASFDVHATRTQSDVFKGARAMLQDSRLHDLPLRHLSVCGSALLFASRDVVSFLIRDIGKTKKVDLVDKNPEFVLWASKFSENPVLSTVGCATAQVVTWRANSEKADEFWGVLDSGLGFTGKTDPRYILREKLGRGEQKNLKSVSKATAEYLLCVSYWNSWRTGTTRQLVKVASFKEMPKIES